MNFKIKHKIPGRIRVHMGQSRMSFDQADTLQYFLEAQPGVTKATVYEQTQDAVIEYDGELKELMEALKSFHYEDVQLPDSVRSSSGRALNVEYKEKLIGHVAKRLFTKYMLPLPIRNVYTIWKAFRYIKEGVLCLSKGKLEVPVLDATAITVSILRRDCSTAGSVMFLLGLGEILEEWTHKKSVGDLARSMSLNVGKVWIKTRDQEILVDSASVVPGDHIVIHVGNVIPFDGVVADGEAMINQASMTGESEPVRKEKGGFVYAGTVVEEGELTIEVKAVSGSTRYEKIVTMIEDSEKLKSAVEGRAEHLADRLVPYTFLGTGLTWLLTRNVTRTLSVLMVDFSCALKLAMPLTVLTAIREANAAKITVKGGKYLEAFSEASTIVFDKTGTLTKAQPTLHSVIAFGEEKEDDLLRLAACLEEHFPHSMAKAVVRAAAERNLEHEEVHSKVEYIVAHGIASYVGEKRVVIGSAHFVFEDEKCRIRPEYQQRFGKTDYPRAETGRICKNRHDDWRQRANSSGDRKTDRRGRIPCGSSAGGQGELCPAGKRSRTQGSHGRRRNQRLPGAFCCGCWYCDQRRFGACAGNCGYYSRCGQPAGAGLPAPLKQRNDASDSCQLPCNPWHQRQFNCSRCDRADSAYDIRAAA